MSQWTKEQILNRVRYGGEDPAELGRAGGRSTARKWKKDHRYRLVAERHSDKEIQGMPWNK